MISDKKHGGRCMERIVFQDEYNRNCIFNVPVLNQEKPMVLRMWVAYDRGRRYSQYDYSEVKRGYYLFFSFEETSPDYIMRILSVNGYNCRVFLGEVKRGSKGWHRDFAKLAEKIVGAAIEDMYAEKELDWEQSSIWHWNGIGGGVGLYRDFYKVVIPKEAWLYGKERENV